MIDAAGLIFTCVASSSDEQSEQLGITLVEVLTVFSWVDNLRDGSQISAMLALGQTQTDQGKLSDAMQSYENCLALKPHEFYATTIWVMRTTHKRNTPSLLQSCVE